jgi:hypothetical protein
MTTKGGGQTPAMFKHHERQHTMTIKYTIKTPAKVYEFKTLKQARQFAQYLAGMTIINQVKG